MNEPAPEVKVPLIAQVTNDDQWERIHLYNQERMLSNQERMTIVLESLLETQRGMAELATKLHMNMDVLDETLKESSRAMKGFVTNIVQIPIIIVIVGLASWGFYTGKIEEHTWLIIMGVACFRYFADGINGLAKIMGFRGMNGEAKK